MAATAALVLWVGAANAHDGKHLRGCNSSRCDRSARHSCSVDPSCIKRVTFKRWHRTADPYWGIFQAIAQCESGGNWHIEGYFSGGLQFTDQSWHAVGGGGRAGFAIKLEQIYRAVLLMRVQGYGAWPVCRRAAGV